MNNSLFTPPCHLESGTPLINEQQRQFLTAVSRAHAFQLERQGRFPKRIKQSVNTNHWKLTEVLAWIRSRPVIELKEENL